MNSIEELIDKFKEIAKQRWIPSVNNYSNGVGLTFEKLINKNADSMFFPDYYGIEIKCTTRFSRYPISLFTKSFDGPSFYEMNRLVEKYGTADVKYKDKKILMSLIKVNEKTLVNNKYYFEIKVNREQEKLILNVYDKEHNLIEDVSYIDLANIKSRLETKLSNLALVYASKKKIDNQFNYRYYKISFYKLQSFDKFLELLEKNIIKISIIGRVSRSGEEEGRQRNKNLLFQLPKDNITDLFDNIKTIDLG